MSQVDSTINLEILDHLPHGVFMLRRDGTVAFWNHCLEDWTGILKARIVDHPLTDHFPHLGTPKYTSRFEPLFEGGAPATFASQFHPQFLPCTLPSGQPRIQQTMARTLWDELTREWHALFIIQDISQLHRQVAESQRLRKQAQAEIAERQKHQRLLEAIRQIESTFISTKNATQTFDEILTQLLAISESAYGFIGEVLHQDGKPYLKTHAITNIAWNEETRALYDRLAPNFEFFNLNTLFGKVLTTGEFVIANDPQTDRRRGGLPKDHPALKAFLGLPIYYGTEFLGMAGIANRAEGYDSHLVDYLQPLLVSCGKIFHAFYSEQEREKAQRALRESEERLTLATASAGMGIWDWDILHNVLTWDETMFTLYGISPQKFSGAYEAWSKGVHPDDLEKAEQELQLALEGKKIFNTVFRVIWEDQSIHHIAARGIVQKEQDGQPVRMIGVNWDITNQKREEENRAHLQRAIEQSVEGLALHDQEGKFTYCNRAQAAMYGYPADELIGQPWQILYSQPQVDYIENTCFPILHSTGKWQGELIGLRKDGMNFPVEVSLSLLFQQDQTPAGLVCTCRDITERKDAEAVITQATQTLEKQNHELALTRDQALAAARSKSEFLATMSHEIRTPLNGVIGMTELLLSTDLTGDQIEMLDTVKRSGEFLLSIINDILDFSKTDAGKLDLESIDFDIRTVVDEVLDILAGRASQKNLELIGLVYANTPRQLRGDPGRIRQILFNLIGNAIKFTQEGEVVVDVSVVATHTDTTTLKFAITDSGIGIPPEAQQTLFESFTQADSSTTRKFGGTGLGLAICKQLATLMQGQIGVISEEERGSTFWMTIPFAHGSSSPIPLSHAPLKGRRVCIIESNDTIRFLLRHYLQSWEMVCETARNGEEGLALLQQQPTGKRSYDIALLDHTLSETIQEDGLSLAKRIRQDPTISSIPLILLTTFGKYGEGHLAQRAGLNGYLTKPIRHQQLQQCLQMILENEEKAMSSTHHSPNLITRHTVQEAQAHKQTRILLAEDNIVNQKVAVRMLQKLGYQVDVVGNGKEAVEAVSRTAYDLVLMDCHMPEMDGLEAVKKIRKAEREKVTGQIHEQEEDGSETPDSSQSTPHHPPLPIIALTANALSEDRGNCLEAGMDDFLTKPTRIEELGTMIRKWVPHTEENHETVYPTTAETEQTSTILPPCLDDTILKNLKNLGGEDDPEFFSTVIDQFLSDLPRHQGNIQQAIDHQDANALIKAAHTCKGSSGSIGATRLATISYELELMGREGRLKDAREKFSQWLKEQDQTTQALEQERAPLTSLSPPSF